MGESEGKSEGEGKDEVRPSSGGGGGEGKDEVRASSGGGGGEPSIWRAVRRVPF